VRFVRTGATGIRRLAHAANRRERPVDQANDRAEFDARGILRQRITAEFAERALDVTGAFELGEYLLEEFDRQFFLQRQLAYLQNGPAQLGGDAEIDQRAQGVFATFGKIHLLLGR
jgi:hypothetical protein